MQTVLERTLKRRLNKFFMSEKVKPSTSLWMRCKSKSWWRMLRRRVRQSISSTWTKVFEKEVLEVTQQVEMFAFVDIAYLVQQWMPQAKARRQELEKMTMRQFRWRKSKGLASKWRLKGFASCNMWQQESTPVRDYVGYSHLFIDEVQDVSLLWLGTLSNFYFRAEIHGRWRHLTSRLRRLLRFSHWERDIQNWSKLVFPNRTLTNPARLKSAIVVPHKLHGLPMESCNGHSIKCIPTYGKRSNAV